MKINIKSFTNVTYLLVCALFIGLLFWRLFLIYYPFPDNTQIQVWAASYQIIAWCGAIFGLVLSKRWGGYSSVIGRASIAFSLGLLLQSFGQSIFSYYFYTGHSAPYPSLADVGFFGSIPFYAYGMFALAKASGAHMSLKSVANKIQVVIIPFIILGISYTMFLKGYVIDPSSPAKTFLDFGYPLGQAIYISIALLAYSLSRQMLGGIMRKAILFFIIALVVQYASDYTFLYQSSKGIFEGGGVVDFMYSVAYLCMSISLIKLGMTFEKINNS